MITVYKPRKQKKKATKPLKWDNVVYNTDKLTERYQNVPIQNKSLENLSCLIGRILKIRIPESAHPEKFYEVKVKKLYPHMLLGQYVGGLENQYTFNIGLSIGDLIQQGVIVPSNGYFEVAQ